MRFMRLWIVCILTMLACNLPVVPAEEPPLPPTRIETTPTAVDSDSGDGLIPTATLRSDSDVPAQPTATDTPDPTDDSLPTFTPIVQDTATPRVTVTPTSAETTIPSLSFSYQLTWRLDPDDNQFAWADVTLTATGGDGDYTYFRDGNRTSGRQFEYRWGSCQDNPGNFRVESGDGQTFTIDYFETAPCPP